MGAEYVMLAGIVGSTAYGLDREGSDVDRLGVYVTPTEDLLALHPPAETITTHKPDTTFHEVGKYIRLALKCNPTILELLYLPDDLVEINCSEGRELRSIRGAFLSDPYVRNAYGGYAIQQLQKLQRRYGEGKQGFSSDVKNRTAKHARHCFRLLRQGRELLETGEMTVRVSDPEFYWQFDDASVEEITALFEAEDALFKSAKSALPLEPESSVVEEWLLGVRKAHW